MADPSDDIENALEAALDALQPVVTADGTVQPKDSLEAVMQMARAVAALEELEGQQLMSLRNWVMIGLLGIAIFQA